MNVVGVIITTNHKSNGIFLPPDDRRHYVAWSNFDKSQFDKAYWNKLWQWYEAGGLEIVGRYLMNYDLGLRPEGAAAADRGVLGDCFRLEHAGRRRDGRCAGRAGGALQAG